MPPYESNAVESFGNSNSALTDSSEKFSSEINSGARQSTYKTNAKSETTLLNTSAETNNIYFDCNSKELQEQIQQLSAPDRATFDELNELIIEGKFEEFGKRFQDLQRTSTEPTEKLAEQRRLEAISPVLKNAFLELGFNFQFDSEGRSLSLTRFDSKGSRPGTELLIALQMNTDFQGRSTYSLQFRNGLDFSTSAKSTFYTVDGDGKVFKQLMTEDERGLLVPVKPGVPELSSKEKVTALVKSEFQSIAEQNGRDEIKCQLETRANEQAQKEQKQRDAEMQRQLDKAQRDYEKQLEKMNRDERQKSRQKSSEINDDSFDVGDEEEDDFIFIPEAHSSPAKPLVD